MDSNLKEAEARMAVCRECENFNKHIAQCKVCKCFMPVKTRFLSSKCPIEKW